jgi:hypothetical protein
MGMEIFHETSAADRYGYRGLALEAGFWSTVRGEAEWVLRDGKEKFNMLGA